jgi:hypothetical protein
MEPFHRSNSAQARPRWRHAGDPSLEGPIELFGLARLLLVFPGHPRCMLVLRGRLPPLVSRPGFDRSRCESWAELRRLRWALDEDASQDNRAPSASIGRALVRSLLCTLIALSEFPPQSKATPSFRNSFPHNRYFLPILFHKLAADREPRSASVMALSESEYPLSF